MSVEFVLLKLYLVISYVFSDLVLDCFLNILQLQSFHYGCT